MRIDAEFFGKSFLDVAGCLKQIQTEALTKVASISDGNHFSISDEFQEEGIPYYRGQDATGHFFIEQAQPVYIPYQAFALPYMRRSHLRKGDALLSIVGTIGELSLVSSESEATCSCKLAILRPQTIKSGYLSVFLKSRYGQYQIHRLTRGAVQMGLLLEDMDQINIPRFPVELEEAIEKSVHGAKIFLDNSIRYYRHAEQTLLRALGLEDWQPPEVLTYERKAGDVCAAGRLDAEHFQPKYDELIRKLSIVNSVDLRPIKYFSEPLKYGTSEKLVYEAEGIPFLRIADLDNKRFNPQSVQYISKTQASSISDRVSLGDVLVSRSGTLGLAVPITEPFNNAVFGSYFIRTRPDRKVIHPEFMSLFINSLAGQLQVHQKSTGGVQMNLTIEAIENICIPIGNLRWQQSFVDLVEQSLAARKRAHFLLDQAKRAVEIAIEKNEEAAMAFLKQSQESSL
ncbi:MAG: restriction endonuclease subunit S [Deltaproteobacteria bacterium]|nr:restriction endonuclease subunit S [Deltaproteobacteria bacterium]